MTKISDKVVREDLIEQLRAKGADVAIFEDLIERYLFYRKQEIKMQQDIKKNGLCYKAISSTGKEYMKDNPSIKHAVMYNKQCLAILAQLDLSPKTVQSRDGEDDDI